MKAKLVILLITSFFIINTYYDNKFIKKAVILKKYYVMGFWAFMGLSIYIFYTKHPGKSKEMLQYANSYIKYAPIDKQSKDLLSPLFEWSEIRKHNTQETRLLHSGTKSTKRSVSETKKKYVAANQNWKCASCQKQLPAWFEVDHQIRLEHGGTNHISNLVALCRDCHGQKTALENL